MYICKSKTTSLLYIPFLCHSEHFCAADQTKKTPSPMIRPGIVYAAHFQALQNTAHTNANCFKNSFFPTATMDIACIICIDMLFIFCLSYCVYKCENDIPVATNTQHIQYQANHHAVPKANPTRLAAVWSSNSNLKSKGQFERENLNLEITTLKIVSFLLSFQMKLFLTALLICQQTTRQFNFGE